MTTFDVVTLRVFLAVARLGSIGAAARSEHIAASAVSRRMSDLEYNLDTALITRTPTGTSLTSAGEVFAIHCQDLLNKFADVRVNLKRFSDGEAGHFRIAAIPRVVEGKLPFVISRFKQKNPLVKVTLQEIFSRQGPRFLREDLADLVIIYDSVEEITGFDIIPYKQDSIWIVGRKEHPLFQDPSKEKICFKETLDFDHISFHEGGVLDELVAEAVRKERRTLKYDIKVLRVSSLLKCVEAGLGIAVIGKRDLQPYLDNKNLRGLQLADTWALRNLVCLFPKGLDASPIVRRFLEYLVEDNSQLK